MRIRWRALLLGYILGVLLLGLAAPYDPMTTNAANQFSGISAEHLLGTDLLGRDVLSRFLHGGPRSILAALGATAIAVLCGSILGALAVSRGLVSHLASVSIRGLLAIPSLLIALVMMTVLGPGIVPTLIGVGISQLAAVAQIVQILIQKGIATEYVVASRSMGADIRWLLWQHVRRGILPGLASYAAVTFGVCLLNTAGLSFLGLMGEPGIPDWGSLLYEGRQAVRFAPWIAIAPGAAITVLIWLANKAADEIGTSPP